jgi:hypothetical protein
VTSDRLLVRLVGLTVCLLALGAGAVLGVGELRGIDTPLTERLVFLLAGGLLGALTTRLTGHEPVEVTTAPGDVVAVEAAPVSPSFTVGGSTPVSDL